MKRRVRLTEGDLHRIVRGSVNRIINEIKYQTYADAAAAARDRESIFKDAPGYPDTPMRRTYKDDGSLDMDQYNRDSLRQINQSKQPHNFKKGAYRALSIELCGQEDFMSYLKDYVKENGVDDYIADLIQRYKEGKDYIENNETRWSGRNM